MEEKKHKHGNERYPNLVHFRCAGDVGKPLCNAAHPSPKFSENGDEVTCHACQRKAKK
jgi:hypothetical protein